MPTCFVIQPFDGGRFDKRYRDTYRDAIESAGLEPYRVDQDPAVAIPIRDIEEGIRRAEVCFADITEDNPNVWFELGFAFAAKKPVVMVCAETRGRFPFDVQHRTIIRYKTESSSDFSDLGGKITERLKAAVERQLQLEELSDLSPVESTEGLSSHEVVLLVTIAGSASVPWEAVSVWSAKQDMGRAGFTDVAVALATRSLMKKGLIEVRPTEDERGNDYEGLFATERGLDWLETNQDKLILQRRDAEPRQLGPFDEDDSLPF